ncbi:MAG: hypothetical protein GYA12_06200 [Chloroflexi bacterium]|nr:hypothetical protein [Chloroflexota bacterium]
MKKLFSFETLKIHLPIGKTLTAVLFFIFLYLGLLEAGLRLIPFPAAFFVPGIDRELNYPEIDIKLSLLTELQRGGNVNCLLLGSSMVDFGLDPIYINQKSAIASLEDPECFNMAMKAMKPEAVAKITPIMVKKVKPSLLIMGISPVDFTGGQSTIRKFIRAPWILYHDGQPSFEGWWIENSLVYRYWISFLKYRDPAYRADLKRQLTMIDRHGTQKEGRMSRIYEVKRSVAFPDYQISKNDMEGFLNIIDLNSDTMKVMVVEMPVHPDFLSYYIPGGSAGYEYSFLRPIQSILNARGITFVRTQPFIKDIVSADGWKDELHLNEAGTAQFSQWLADELAKLP